MKIALTVAATILSLVASSRIEAGAILYTTTDLGSGFSQPQVNSDGSISGMTTPGGVTYAFMKSVTNKIDNYIYGGSTTNEYQVQTLQNGAYMTGYKVDIDSTDNQNHQIAGGYFYPSFEPHTKKLSQNTKPRQFVI